MRLQSKLNNYRSHKEHTLDKRDLVGYGRTPPLATWPNKARIAVNFNLNYEGGGESTLANGDPCSEGMLNDIAVPTRHGVRDPLVESVFEYGSRVGIWRLFEIFRDFDVRLSLLGVVRALEQNPEVARAFSAAGHEIVSHGYRWIDYCNVSEADERIHIKRALDGLKRITGTIPVGWMTGRPGPNTRRLLIESKQILYDRDALNDELPYWVDSNQTSHLVIPYSYETNDNRFNENSGFNTSDDFFTYMKDAFDLMYKEGATKPKLLSIGLHDRLIGRPARAIGLIRLLEYMRKFDDVWFCRGIDVAEHWATIARPNFPTAYSRREEQLT